MSRAFDLTMECKNLRSDEKYADGSYKLETQKTRNQKAAGFGQTKGTRWYKATEFDIVAACLFNQTGRWEYCFARTSDLVRHPKDSTCLNTMQRVPPSPKEPWKATLQEVLALFSGKKK